jgi:hypothetical protein
MARKTSVLVYGAGGHGRVVLDAALSIPDLRVVGIVDDDPSRRGQRLLGVEILGMRQLSSQMRVPRRRHRRPGRAKRPRPASPPRLLSSIVLPPRSSPAASRRQEQ